MRGWGGVQTMAPPESGGFSSLPVRERSREGARGGKREGTILGGRRQAGGSRGQRGRRRV